MQRIKYLALGITCFLLGGALLQPVFAEYSIADLENIFVRKSWMKSYLNRYYATKSSTYTKTQSNSRYVGKTGNHTMAGSLTAEDISINNNLTFNSPKVQNIVIPAAGFIPNSNADIINRGTGNYVYSDSTLWAAVSLPNGVTLTEIEFCYNDVDAGSDASLTLYRQALGSGAGGQYMATVESTGSSGWGSTSTTTITYPVIDNNTYQYMIFVIGTNANKNVQAVRLEYSFDTI